METSSANFGTENELQISGASETKYTRATQDTNVDDMHELKEVKQDQRKKPTYIVVDNNKEAHKLTKMSDFKVLVDNIPGEKTKKRTKTWCNMACLGTWLLACVFIIGISAVTSFATQKYISPHFQPKVEEVPQEQINDKPQFAPLKTKEQGESRARHGTFSGDSRERSREFHWATFYLNTNKFYKGIPQLPWESESDEGTGITLTDSGCFKIHKTSVYEIYPTITYEFTRENKTGSGVYLNVQNVRNGERDMLEIHTLTIPYRPPQSNYRVLQSTNIMIIKEFQAGDSIYIHVSDTSLVYGGRLSNSVKIVQRGH